MERAAAGFPLCILALHSSSPLTHGGAEAPVREEERTEVRSIQTCMRGMRFLVIPSKTTVTARGKGVWSSLSAFNSKPKATWGAGKKKATRCILLAPWGWGERAEQPHTTTFPLKIPQARSCLAGGCQGRAVSTLCFLLIGGINNLLLLSIHPNLFCTEKGKASRRQTSRWHVMVIIQHPHMNEHWCAPSAVEGWEVWGCNGFCKGCPSSRLHLCCADPSLTAPSYGSAQMAVAQRVLQLFRHCWAKVLLPGSSSWSHPAANTRYFHSFLPVAEETSKRTAGTFAMISIVTRFIIDSMLNSFFPSAFSSSFSISSSAFSLKVSIRPIR